jgi:hypothetical protein
MIQRFKLIDLSGTHFFKDSKLCGFNCNHHPACGNGTHLGSTANVFIVTLSERLAKESGNPELAITPGLWIKKGTPVMILTLLVSSVIF